MRFLKRIIKKKKEKKFLVLDFSENSLKGLIFVQKKDKIEIKEFNYQNLKKIGVFFERNFETTVLKNAFQKLIEKLKIREEISDLEIVYTGSPKFLKAKIVEISLKRKFSKKPIDHKEKEVVYQKVFQKAKDEFGSFLKKNNWQVLKQKIIEQKVNGYEVESILAKKGEELVFKVLTIFIAKKFFKNVKKLENIFSLKKGKIFHLVEGLISFFNINNSLEGLFFDIGFQFSQIFLKRENNNIQWIGEISLGSNTITKKICQTLNLLEEEGEDLKLRFFKNKLTPQLLKKIKKIIYPVLIQFGDKLEGILKEAFEKLFFIPSQIYLFGGGSFLLPQIRENLQKRIFESLGVKNFQIKNFPFKNFPFIIKKDMVFSPRILPLVFLTFCFQEYGEKNY